MSGNFAYRSIIYWEFTTAESTLTHAYTYKEKNQALEQGDQQFAGYQTDSHSYNLEKILAEKGDFTLLK